jgi:hypothetical protein
MDLAFAAEYTLRASKDVSSLDMPHDFMWLIDANGALKILVSGFKTQGLISHTEADSYLRATLHPSGSVPDTSDQMSLLNIEGLTNAQIIGRVYLQAISKGANRASKAERVVAVTITLEQEVLNGGFGQFFYNWSDEAGAAAENAYKQIGREDLATLVSDARVKASRFSKAETLGHPEFEELNSKFWKALRVDPTSNRASYVKVHLDEQ